MIRPSFSQYDALSSHADLIPMCMEMPGDLNTPVSALMKIDDGRRSFLLESVEGGERWARYSFIGSEPRAIVEVREGSTRITDAAGDTTISTIGDAADALKAVMTQTRAATLPGLPDFYGGAVGFFAYDAARDFERIPDLKKSDLGFAKANFLFTRDMVVFDNHLHKILLITMTEPARFGSLEQSYADGKARLERLISKLEGPLPPHGNGAPKDPIEYLPEMSRDEFERLTLKAKKHIKAGDIIQVVLSQRFGADFAGDPRSVYRGLRMINPSPYMFFLRMDDEILAGSSPEVMVRVRNGEAAVRPIAGTRARGETPALDMALERELLMDEKEIAEHVMLVDLARNDLGRIAQPGSVKVDAFKTVERYSHVMHLVTNVRAALHEKTDMYDALRATFPAGTLSGAPKIRAMEIIEELEPVRRGPYGGCVGYFSYGGSMDMGITIRTVMMKGGRAYFQAGAGIVADSIPEREYEETMKKAEAMRRALALSSALPGRRS